MKINLTFLLLILLSAGILTQAQTSGKKITLEKIYQEYIFSSHSVSGINSMLDGKHYTVNSRGLSINKHRYKDGEKVSTLFSAGDHPEITYFSMYEFSSNERKVLLTTNIRQIYRHSFMADYYVYDLKSGSLVPVSINGKQQLATFSPGGDQVAFVRANNIFICDLETGKETQVTSDGIQNKIINGAPDWVYEEEFGFSQGFHWSPDGQKILYYKFDESKVKEFGMTVYGELYPEITKFKYPKAGERNSDVTLHVYDVVSMNTIRLATFADNESYIPRIKWTNDPNLVSITWLNRLQNHIEIIHCDASTGNTEVVYEEDNSKYISEATDNMITYLPDNNSFLLISERSGYFHFYLYDFKSGKLSNVTRGNWDIHSLLGVDMKRKELYYSSYEESSIELHVYSIKFNGSSKRKISTREGSNNAVFSNSYDYYILTHSNANTPPSYTLFSRKGDSIRVLETNEELQAKMEEFNFGKVEFMEIPTESGQSLNGYMIKPKDFDPEKKYPLFMFVYGGPESQNVIDRWERRGPWFQLLVQEGYIVACVDNRGTNGRGEEFRKSTYMKLGELETIDQIQAANYLGSLSYIDDSRIGMFGWSYGGFMTSLCMTKGGGLFKMGIAVAPVTNWRYYDTVYTERFMRTPDENPDGYDENSPLNFADQLEGNFLLIHGMGDDNVHFQNSVDFVEALVQSDKQFDIQFYPNKNHSIYGGNTTYHLYTRMTEFVTENL